MSQIVDRVLGGLRDPQARESIRNENANRHETGPEALALGKPSEYTVDDRIGGTHTRNVLDAVVHENVLQHAHHEVTPIVQRERHETEIHQKVQPVLDKQEHHTHHQHVAPHVSRHVHEDITDEHATKYRSQGQHQHQQVLGEQTHSTSVNAPIVREVVHKHIIEEIQPIIQRQIQRVEHHHTTQQINETHVKAPVIHSVVHNPVITMEEFAGKVSNLVHGRTGSNGSNTAGASGYGSNTGGATGYGVDNKRSSIDGGRGGLAGALGSNHHNTSSGQSGTAGMMQPQTIANTTSERAPGAHA